MNPAAVDLETFVRSEIGPDLGSRCVIRGPALRIDAQATAVLAPVLHQCISDGPGSGNGLAVVWSCDHQGRCVIELIAAAVPDDSYSSSDLGSRSARQRSRFEKFGDGLIHCEMSDRGARITIPARYVASWQNARSTNHLGSSADPLTGRSVLVVEDQLLIALDLETLLLEQGAAAVQLCGSAEDALRSISLVRPDLAILDVNLGSTTSFPVAFELQRLGVSFIFASGYGREVEWPPELASIPLVAKPYRVETIREALLTVSAVHA